ncbi:MAG TPA: hypothetical protein VFE46_02060 [Pirellulales bacterium]|jgi:hypothetical protein|nr:hypothetical protein [Pirellulales bacterium]
MTVHHPPATHDDVLLAIGSLIDHIKVLVSAVDDLRCEVEWQSRNPRDDHPAAAGANLNSGVGKSVLPAADQEISIELLLTAAGRLQAFEKLLYQAPRGVWLDEFASEDDYIIPEGRVFSLDADLWTSVLDVRPAHVVGDSCCCEAGEGTPFLLAWQTEREFLLRELTYDEARKLQEFCLACQAERADAAIQEARLISSQSQLGLF